MQNRSHAVMSQRTEARGSLDDFPTQPWATRALLVHVLSRAHTFFPRQQTCLEPACGRGDMDRVLKEHFKKTTAADVYPYGYGELSDFRDAKYPSKSFDWVITNPPFSLAETFVKQSLKIARVGVAIFARTAFIESVGRYERLFKPDQPAVFAPFVERVPLVKGRLSQSVSTATSYAWYVWYAGGFNRTETIWIPPCRRQLEKGTDYRRRIVQS